jgi:hypothetical protein
MRWNHHLPSGLSALKLSATCLLAALWTGGSPSGLCEANDVVFSSNARFRIPYQLDATEIRRLRATEIQLHVSTDQAKNWRNVDSVPPVAGKFTFEAAQDGEYWFSVRTISEDGRHHPSGPLVAGLKVHVDTQLPTLNLQLSQTDAGEVALRWDAADDHLAVESLAVEYRASEEHEWEAVTIEAAAAGQTSWSVPTGGMLSVRGRIQDLAGNEASAQTELSISAPVSTPVPSSAPAAPTRRSREPIAEGPLPADESPLDPFVAATTRQPASAPDAARITALPVINPYGSDYSQFVSQREATAATTPLQPEPLQAEPLQPQPPQTPQPQQPQTRRSDTPLPQSEGPAAQHASPLSPQQAPASRSLPQPAAPAVTTPQRPRVRRVNSTSFQIGYALEDVGPSGVSSVDLFLTEDGGRKWFHYGSDDDATSPFEVRVPQDGTYGFALRVRSGVGLSQSPPQPGDTPEVSIAVDRQPPQANLKPLKQGNGQQPGQMLIEWTISDEELAERPVSLYYASHLNGPWQPITGWEPNTGNYLWTFSPDVPKQVYIRLEARDAAGNIARADSPTPLLIDLSRPTARIIEVDPIPTRN